jgi:hypothetical protein
VERLWIAMIWKFSQTAERGEIPLAKNGNHAGEGAQFRALARAAIPAHAPAGRSRRCPGIADFRRVDNVWTAAEPGQPRGD